MEGLAFIAICLGIANTIIVGLSLGEIVKQLRRIADRRN